jgi:hypothetical protein
MSLADFLVILLVVIYGAIGFSYIFKNSNSFSLREIQFLQWLYLYHMVVSLAFSFYIRHDGGDALVYWFEVERFSLMVPWESYYRTGTSFIVFLTYPLVKYWNLSFYTGGLLFAMIGFNGFIYLYSIIRKFIKKPIYLYGIRVFPYILFLPNLHFWSSGIGKDALSFFAILLFYYALFLMVSSFIAIIIDGKMRMSMSIKISLGVVMLVAGVVLFNAVVSYMRLDDVSTESIREFSETKTTNLSKGSGSAVAIAGYPFPLKLFTFLYRPLFFDISNALAVISSVENLILLYMTGVMFVLRPFAAFKAAPMQVKSMLIFFFICTCAFALTLSNLGIMLRQKNPVVSCLFVFIFWCFAYILNLKVKRKN